MRIRDIFKSGPPEPHALPGFIREVQDVKNVRILRLHGSVGKDIGGQVREWQKEDEESGAVFERPLLMDFAGTTDWDFSTVSYLVLSLSKRMHAHARVGIIHAPPELLAELKIVKLDNLFEVFDTEAEALAALSSQQ